MKKYLLATMVLLSSAAALAEAPNCTAEVFESFPDGHVRSEKVALNIESQSATHVTMLAELDGRAYSVSGSILSDGPYMLSITEAPDHTRGSLATASFIEDGRIQISVVDGRLVHKLVCLK